MAKKNNRKVQANLSGQTTSRSRKKEMDAQIMDFIASNAYSSAHDLASHLDIPIDENNHEFKFFKTRLALLIDKEQIERKADKSGNVTYFVPQNIGYILARLVRPSNDPQNPCLEPISWPKNNIHKKPEIIELDKHHKLPLKKAKDGEVFVVRTQSVKKGRGTTFKASVIDNVNQKIAGIVEKKDDGSYKIRPATRKKNYSLPIEEWALNGAEEGDFVEFKITNKTDNEGTPTPVVTQLVGGSEDWHSISPAVASEFGLSQDFNQKVLDELDQLKDPNWTTANRTDLRSIPFVTIDDVTTKDMDDAIFVEPTLDDKGKQTGWKLIVAIADVAQYFPYKSEIDSEAQHRGNTNYLPGYRCDMIPTEIAADKASLVPDEDRSCLAIHMRFDMDGKRIDKKIQRGIMRSRAKLNHDQVENALNGDICPEIAPHMEQINYFHALYEKLAANSKKRLKLPIQSKEQKIAFDAENNFDDIKLIDYKVVNMIIEEFMVEANVCAEELLEDKGFPSIVRSHKKPREKGKEFHGAVLNSLGYNFEADRSGNAMRKQLIRILNESVGTEEQELVHQLVTMMQSRAEYSANQDDGHYGLALEKYAHFTSPIRRYADLMVHRFLITAYNLGEGGLQKNFDKGRLRSIADHISGREDLAKRAEREAKSRFCAAWLENELEKVQNGQTPEEFDAIIVKADQDGLIIKLKKNGVEGHIPVEFLPGTGNYHHLGKYNTIAGREEIAPDTYRDLAFQQGASIKVRISNANAALNSIKFEPTLAVSSIIGKYEQGIFSELDEVANDAPRQRGRKRKNSSFEAREKRKQRHKRNRHQPE